MSEDKILRDLQKIKGQNEEILDRLLEIEKSLGLKDGMAGMTSYDYSSKSRKPSDVAEEQKEGAKNDKSDDAFGRLECPKCDAVGSQIGRVDDKKDVISYMSGLPQYGKKYSCKRCGWEWK